MGGRGGGGRWREGGREGLKDGNVVVDLGAVPLGDALCDPHDVPALLLLQLDVGVEDAEVELVEEGQLVQLHLRHNTGTSARGDEVHKEHQESQTHNFYSSRHVSICLHPLFCTATPPHQIQCPFHDTHTVQASIELRELNLSAQRQLRHSSVNQQQSTSYSTTFLSFIGQISLTSLLYLTLWTILIQISSWATRVFVKEEQPFENAKSGTSNWRRTAWRLPHLASSMLAKVTRTQLKGQSSSFGHLVTSYNFWWYRNGMRRHDWQMSQEQCYVSMLTVTKLTKPDSHQVQCLPWPPSSFSVLAR